MKTPKLPLALGFGSLVVFIALIGQLHVGVFAASDSLVLIPQTNWTLLFVDSQELSGPAQNGCCDPTPATNAFDGDPNTFWNTQWVTAQPGFPHEIQIDLGASYSIGGFRHLPRQDGLNNGRLKQYDFFVSSDGVNWGTAVASGSFPDTDQPTDVMFVGGTVNGRYIRLVAYSNYSADGFSASLAELNVWADNASPTPTPTATATATPQPTATPTASSTPTPTATATPAATATATPTATPTPTPTTTIVTQPADQTVPVGQSATFTVGATGSGPLTYKWRKNGKPISGPGANGPSYTTPPTTMADNGAKFSVTVSSGGGTVTSNNATLNVVASTPTPTPTPPPPGAPPVIISVTANPAVLWPPDHSMRSVTITVNAIDSSGLMPTCRIIGVTSNQQLAPNDFVITGNLSVELRADRSGKNKQGRIYTITIRCTDTSGHSSEATVTVTVPHSQGKPKKHKK